MRILDAAILLCFFFSCTNKYPFQKLNDIDQIQVHWRNNREHHISTDLVTIDIFKEVLKGKAKKVKDIDCDVDGYIWFMKGNEAREVASFSLKTPDCVMLTISDGEAGPYSNYKLTYRAGMYLDHVTNKKEGNVRNN